MSRPAGLLGHSADLMTGADEPHRLAQRTLEVVMALVDGRSSGVFEVSGERLTLFASRGIDQPVLDAVELLWARCRRQFQRGEPVYVPGTGTDLELVRVASGGPASLAMFPVFDDDALIALLYVDSAEPHFCQTSDVERLAQFSRMLARALRPEQVDPAREPSGWEAYLERTPVQDIERQKLVLLLNRNEWNIARVARLMGVTRRTVYLRLQRYNIPREHVGKTRSAAAS